MNLKKALKNTYLFQNLDSDDVVDDLASKCRQKDYPKGEAIFSMGDEARCFFIVLAGWVKLYRVSKDGEEVIVHVFGPGESFAEAAVLNERQIYPVNALAVENAALIQVPRSFFIQKIEQDSRFSLRMLGAISARHHYLVQQLEQVTTRTAPQRIGAFLLRFCKNNPGKNGGWIVDLPYDKSVISARLNIQPETFSRALAKLGDYGVVTEKKNIVIRDRASLADFCDVPLDTLPLL